MFQLIWTPVAEEKYAELEAAAKRSVENRKKNQKAKASPLIRYHPRPLAG